LQAIPKPWSRRLEQHEDRVFLVLTIVIGAVVGLVVVAFIVLTGNLGARLYPADGSPGVGCWFLLRDRWLLGTFLPSPRLSGQ